MLTTQSWKPSEGDSETELHLHAALEDSEAKVLATPCTWYRGLLRKANII